MAIVVAWWIIDARKWFKGPKVNVEHLMVGQDGNAIDGKGDDSSENIDHTTGEERAKAILG